MNDELVPVVAFTSIMLMFITVRLTDRVKKLERRIGETRAISADGSYEPVCGCTDHFSHHDPKTLECKAVRRTETKWDSEGDPTKYEMRQCTCRRYVGPQPLDSLYATEISTGIVKEDPKE